MEERLHKVLARAGIASRREAERLIESGRVTVNGRVVRELGVKVDPRIDVVAFDTVPLRREMASGEGPRTYLLLNKPKGVVCTAKDPHGRPTVLDLVPPFPGKRLYPVGRLDEDSEGLVLLTNDGELTARLTHPRFGVPKVYDVRVKGKLLPEDVKKFEAGVWLSEGRTGRSRCHVRKRGIKYSHASVTLTEGANREIRRAFAKLGFPVISLRRIQIGPIVSRSLKVGQFRPLAPDEVADLHAASRPGARDRGARATTGKRSAPGGRRPGKPDPARTVERAPPRGKPTGPAGRTAPPRGRAPARGKPKPQGRGRKPSGGGGPPKGRGPSRGGPKGSSGRKR